MTLQRPNGEFIRLSAAEPFSYAHNLDYLRRSPDECLYRIADGGVIHRAVRLGDRPVLLEIREAEDVEPGLDVRIETLGEAEAAFNPAEADAARIDYKDEAARYVREWFDLDHELQPFYAMADADPLLQGAAGRFRGLRLMGIPDLFEALCWGIIGQQINLAFAYTLKKRFVQTFGQSAETEGHTLWMFPEPQRIAELEVGDLTPLQLTARKSEYLIGVARLMAEGRLDKQSLLAKGSVAEIEKSLVGLRGIGPWTANYVMMRCLRLKAAFPIDDVGLHNAIKTVIGSEAKPSKSEIMRLAAGWSGWEAYATFYLWRVCG
ncbi:DNA-3-methyladenine glycosylase family protein [Paenibacillus thailandensis]|uniref:DNA-3-methyladenine glycosylase II n=1 Tax=Paenibacillus thailandensis TaxID=393250 RepID=A0ABW5R5J0_9BACL